MRFQTCRFEYATRATYGSGNDERDQTLNQLLVELDGGGGLPLPPYTVNLNRSFVVPRPLHHSYVFALD